MKFPKGTWRAFEITRKQWEEEYGEDDKEPEGFEPQRAMLDSNFIRNPNAPDAAPSDALLPVSPYMAQEIVPDEEVPAGSMDENRQRMYEESERFRDFGRNRKNSI